MTVIKKIEPLKTYKRHKSFKHKNRQLSHLNFTRIVIAFNFRLIDAFFRIFFLLVLFLIIAIVFITTIRIEGSKPNYVWALGAATTKFFSS